MAYVFVKARSHEKYNCEKGESLSVFILMQEWKKFRELLRISIFDVLHKIDSVLLKEVNYIFIYRVSRANWD